MEDEIQQDCRKDACDDGKDDVTHAQDAGAYFHPVTKSAEDSADHRSAVIFVSIKLFHVLIV